VGRVIFISTPHRGSEIASNWIGRLGIALVKLPANLTKTGTAVMRFETKAGADVQKPNRLHFPTSIDTLSPNKGFVLALNTLPIVSHIPYHSIIGDRGRGDTPNGSDGVVLTGALIWQERNRNGSYRQTTALTKTRREWRKYTESCC
jgi:hypothetical protein